MQGCLKSVRLVRAVGAQRQTELTFYAEHRADGLMRLVGGALGCWLLACLLPQPQQVAVWSCYTRACQHVACSCRHCPR